MDELPPVNLVPLPDPRSRRKRPNGTFEPGAGGRLPQFTDDDVRSRLLGFIKMGATYRRAAAATGVGPSTINEWIKRAKDGEEPYQTFWQEILEAEAFAEMRLLGYWSKAAETNWQAARDLLKVRFRADWNVDALAPAELDGVDLDEPIETVEHLSAIAAAIEEAGITIVEAADG